MPLSGMSCNFRVQLVQAIPEPITPAIALLPALPEATTIEDTEINDMVKFITHSIILKSL